MPENIIEVKDLSVKLGGHPILRGISFTVREQEILAIIGPNGSGKSTLVKALLGLLPHSGQIKMPSLRIGYVPQYLDFDRSFPVTVEEFFLMNLPRAGFWLRSAETAEEIKKYLRYTGAGKLYGKPLGTLSGGELQRVMIACALTGNPEVLILDEPLAGVDVGGEESIQDLIEKLHKEFKLTIIMVSHDLDIVSRHASSVVCLNGEMVCFGSPADVLTNENLNKLYGQVKGFYHKHE
ncbi:metal ABC transporter ATP-binding protein [Candidatus Uhrbacteria bacterium]|nr:metal ABC transporter ATP-binding protein [Candidatus Uhrbacteria bacterium]